MKIWINIIVSKPFRFKIKKLCIRDFLIPERYRSANLTFNSSDVFTNLFLYFFSVWAVEKENKLLIGPKQVFFSVHQLKTTTWQTFVRIIVDSEFKIGETIWWIRYLSLNSQKIWNALAQIFISLGKMVRYYFFYPFYLHKKSWNLLYCLSLFLYNMTWIFRFCLKNVRPFFNQKRWNVYIKIFIDL